MEDKNQDQLPVGRQYAHNQEHLNWSVVESNGMYRRLLVVEYTGEQDCTGVCVCSPGVGGTMNLGSPYTEIGLNRRIGVVCIDGLPQDGQGYDLDVYSSPESIHWIKPRPDLALGVEPRWYLGTIRINNLVDGGIPLMIEQQRMAIISIKH